MRAEGFQRVAPSNRTASNGGRRVAGSSRRQVAGGNPGRPSKGKSAKGESKETWRARAITAMIATLAFVAGGIGGAFLERTGARIIGPIQNQIDPSLYVNETYPVTYCSEPQAAVYDYSVEELAETDADMSPGRLIQGAKAEPFHAVSLYLVMSTAYRGDTLLILEIEPVVFSFEPVEPEWVATHAGGGCGDSLQRAFDLKLADGKANIQDLGVVGTLEMPDSTTTVPTAPLGRSFNISQSDTYDIDIRTEAVDGRYEFGVIIHYMLDGEDFEYKVGTPEDPFVLGGGTPTAGYVAIDDAGRPNG
jgi:hypothetical protein